MTIFALSDPHFSFKRDVGLFETIDPERDIHKPMELFGWERHYEKIRDQWIATVQSEDTVLIPGDISWALRISDAMPDFNYIDQLPGKKVLSPGNHCYYAQTKSKVRKALPSSMKWIDGDYTLVGEHVVVATRGWNLPGDRFFDQEKDQKIYLRQVGRLAMALSTARKDHPAKPIIAMLHYPPLTKQTKDSGFFQLLKEYQVDLCIYGHLHGKAAQDAVQGLFDGVQLQLVACDYLQFAPMDCTRWIS